MSSGTGETSPEAGGLQFDHAEFDQAEPSDGPACASCRRPIVDHYFEINGTVVCETCRLAIESHLGGSDRSRLIRAAAYGLGAAIVGTLVYTAFLYWSPVDLSLIAILVGFLVGKMVRKGSGGLGGLSYQLLAVFLTYTSLALTYLSVDLLAFFRENKAALAILNRPEFYAECLKNLYMVPAHKISRSPILVAFVGFAVWEAWKFNRRLPLVVTGPYRVGEAGPTEGVPANA